MSLKWRPLTPEERERHRKMAKEGKIMMAPFTLLREDPHIYAHLMEIIERIMGGQVFISDESMVSDFPEGFKGKLERELDFHMEEDETFVEIVQRMKEKNNPQ